MTTEFANFVLSLTKVIEEGGDDIVNKVGSLVFGGMPIICREAIYEYDTVKRIYECNGFSHDMFTASLPIIANFPTMSENLETSLGNEEFALNFRDEILRNGLADASSEILHDTFDGIDEEEES